MDPYAFNPRAAAAQEMMGGAPLQEQETALERLNRKRKADLQSAMGAGGKILGGLAGGIAGGLTGGPAGALKGAGIGMGAGEALGGFGGGLL